MVREDFCEEMAGDVWSELEMNIAEKEQCKRPVTKSLRQKESQYVCGTMNGSVCNKYCLQENIEICSLVSQK